MIRRSALLAAPVLLAGATAVAAQTIHVTKTATCGCCAAWLGHLREAGLDPIARDLAPADLARLEIENGITPETASCHTALVEGYVIEGHVPAAEIGCLLAERPEAIGLSVPGMPVGSPGMETGARRDAYDVALIGEDGATSVYASYPAR
ncbi:MAG: DUF411 domain-containing protein [Paracoccaceae bacterium]